MTGEDIEQYSYEIYNVYKCLVLIVNENYFTVDHRGEKSKK